MTQWVNFCVGDTMSIRQSILATNRLYLTERHTLRVILSGAASPCIGERESRQMPRSRTPKGRRQAESRHSCKALCPNAPHSPKKRDSRTLPKRCTDQNDKNFPQEHPSDTKRNKFSPCKGGSSWGKFSEGVGGLEGEGVLFQEDSLSLQGLLHTIRNLTPSSDSGESAAGAEANAFFAPRSETGTW